MTQIATNVDAAFEALVERFHAARLQRHPTWGTVLGRHEHDAALEDFTLDGLAEEVAELKELRLEFEEFDRYARTSDSA